ncbi:Transcriptional regulatory protein moc3 [Lachnellula arida]|uniref:Transcriptional regulatory protein moc3 n=1 Tax=Lachnellula arida TaxID=1316785 RepID=A0A8T9B607_9HELO|nr:Transcriptional regulatory protein moc3 [Lachnellula arida]
MDRRVRTGCITCRKRRIKCDEAKPICARCRSANFLCEGYATPKQAPATALLSDSSPRRNSHSLRERASFGELSWRHTNWRQEQLPLYHHFVTTTVVRLFRSDHVNFWRDQVAQMSFGLDVVYEALLAIGAMHRSSLLSCLNENAPEATKLKVLGLRAYGETLRLLPSHLGQNTTTEISAVLVVLMLLAYFECFMENPKGTFRHLWAAIQLLRTSENRFSDAEVSHILPVYDAILRLDFLAQKLVPYAGSSFLRFSNVASLESPFWNRVSPEFSDDCHIDPIAVERYSLIRLICGHDRLSRIIWGLWVPTSERPTRDELMSFYSEMQLWKANSPATFASFDDQDSAEVDAAPMESFPIPPYASHFSSTDAALNVVMYNAYLGCAVAMIGTNDPDPASRELEAFKLVYETLRITAGLIEKHKESLYKPCDAISVGISTYLYHSARRCFSSAWQEWTIAALRSIGREGLSNGFTLANTLETMCELEARIRHDNVTPSCNVAVKSPLGPINGRLIPLLLPHEEGSQLLAFYLRYGNTEYDRNEQAVQVVAKATWTEDISGTVKSMNLEGYESAAAGDLDVTTRPQAVELFHSWRNEVEKGWHGYLTKEVQEGFLQKEGLPNP